LFQGTALTSDEQSLEGEVEAAELAEQLNALGRDRWEVFWLDPAGSDLRVFLKRPVRSYLRQVPLSELQRLLPGGSE